MRMRRLKSVIAPTMAARFVFAFVNFMASSSSRSGISTVVFIFRSQPLFTPRSINMRFQYLEIFHPIIRIEEDPDRFHSSA